MSNPWADSTEEVTEATVVDTPWGDSVETVSEEPTFSDRSAVDRGARGAIGAYDVMGAMVLGGLKESAAGVAGVGDLVYSLVTGDADPLLSSVETIENVRGMGPNLFPVTEGGEYLMEEIEKPMQAYADYAKKGGKTVLEKTGSPELATFEETLIMMAPSMIGMRKTPGKLEKRRQDVKGVEARAHDAGISMEGNIGEQGVGVIRGAEDITGGRQTRGQNFEDIQEAVIQSRKAVKEQVDALYQKARETKASVPASEVNKFAQNARAKLMDYDIETMPIVQKRLGELAEIETLPEASKVKLNALSTFRQRLTKQQAAATDLSQNAALGILKGELDSFLDGMFNADMISGNPAAVQKWKDARAAYSDYAQTFKADKVIKQLGEQAAKPEEIRNWIYGASAVGAKKQAGAVVEKLKKIVGEDSPQFASLRQDVLFDIVEPLLREEPNFKTFVQKYDKFAKNQPTMSAELFPDSQSSLKTLYDHAKALEKSSGQKINFDLNQAVSQALFGHGIAKAGLRVRLAKLAIGAIRRMVEGSDKRRLMSELVGYDVGQPVIPLSPALVSGAIEYQENQK